MTNSFPDDWDNCLILTLAALIRHFIWGGGRTGGTLSLTGQQLTGLMTVMTVTLRPWCRHDRRLRRFYCPNIIFHWQLPKKTVLFCFLRVVFLIVSHFIWMFRKHAHVSNGLSWTGNKQISNQKQEKALQIRLETFLIKIILIGFNSGASRKLIELCPQL